MKDPEPPADSDGFPIKLPQKLERRPRVFWMLVGLGFLALVGLIDYWTGYDFSFSVFYLLGAKLAWADLPSPSSVASVSSCETGAALLNYWGHPLDGYVYTNDAWGLRTNITRQLGLSTNTVSAGYDGIGELASWTGKEPGGAPRRNEQLGYGYDAAGNLQSRTNGALVQTFTDDTLNQLSSVTRAGSASIFAKAAAGQAAPKSAWP
jgi:hypothetical protein